jgi:hypothetical protein
MTTLLRIRVGVCLIGTIVASFTVGFGDVSADEPDAKTRAQTLFLEGRQAIDANDWNTGCPKVRESLGLFAVANSLFTVAQCDERDGHLIAALEHWNRGMALVDATDPRAAVAKDRIATLEPRVPRIRVVIPAASASATVWLDGVQLEPAALAAPLRVDPGKHVFVVRAKGRQDNRREIDIAEKERTEFVANIGAADTAGPTPTATSSASSSTAPPPPMHPRKVAGFVVGGVGAASLIVSAVTGNEMSSVHQTLDTSGCAKSAKGCFSTDIDKYKNLYLSSAITFGVGLAGVGAGVIMILTAPKKPDDKPANALLVPMAVPGGAGIGLSGRF